jgi:hypothetical protein
MTRPGRPTSINVRPYFPLANFESARFCRETALDSPHSHSRFQHDQKGIGELSPHIIGFSGGLIIDGSTRTPARFFYAEYETLDFVFHSAFSSFQLSPRQRRAVPLGAPRKNHTLGTRHLVVVVACLVPVELACASANGAISGQQARLTIFFSSYYLPVEEP